MGHSRRSSRSRSRDRDRSNKTTDKSSSSKSSNGSSSKREGSRDKDKDNARATVSGSTGSRNDSKHEKESESRSGREGGKTRDHSSRKSRSRSREKDRNREKDRGRRTGESSSSRRSDRDEKDRDRDNSKHYSHRHHHRDGSSSNRRDRKDRDRERDRSRERDRKRSRSSRDGGGGSSRSGRRSKYESDSEGAGGEGANPDERWKRKLRDEEEELLNIDPDDLMVDEEEEERRLEEERRRRKEKLEALQKKSLEAEKARKEAAAAAVASQTTKNGEAVAAADQSMPGNSDDTNDQEKSNNSGDVVAAAAAAGGDDSGDDDAGPIEIVKQGSDHAFLTANENDNDQRDDDDDDNEQEDLSGAVPGEGRSRKKIDGKQDAGRGALPSSEAGKSSSELRAHQGKEDRPVFDMFSAVSLKSDAVGPKIGGKGTGGNHMSYLGGDDGGDQGNWTDVEGYYKTRVGEVIGGRYTVLGTVGQGVFSTVLKCLDTRAGPGTAGGASEVALKMIRNNDTMRKAAQKEVSLLKELAEHDPANKKHCIRMLCSLEHKQHTVMVFESMQMNLRETLKKFGRKTGINIHAVQKYAKQLMAALKHMASRRLVHADIKPDNILVDQGFGSLKLADFGSAFRETDPDNDPTPYLVSRWYRAPEIVLGLEYDKAIDLWSVAVTLYELYKGVPVIPGANNNEMLKRMMDMKGAVAQRMIKAHIRSSETMGPGFRPHFTERGEFMQQEPDPVSGEPKVRLVTITGPSKPIKTDIMRSKGAQDSKETVSNLADFLDKCMSLDPRQRISLDQCSAHSFLRR